MAKQICRRMKLKTITFLLLSDVLFAGCRGDNKASVVSIFSDKEKNRGGKKMKQYSKIILCCLLASFLVGCATGSVILTGTARTATDPESVKLYLQEPKKYDVLGIVEASSDSGWTDQGSQDYAVAELRKQAAKIGANGVLLTNTGTQTSTVVGTSGNGVIWAAPVNAKVVKGTAIFVTEE